MIPTQNRPARRAWLAAGLWALLAGAILASCSLPAASATPVPVPPTPSVTPSIAWFPATNTPTVFTFPTRTNTVEPLVGLTDLVFADDFGDALLWNTAASGGASAQVADHRLTLSLSSGRQTVTSLRSEPLLVDFYAEVTAATILCRGGDQYGLVFRAAPGGSYYRFVLACDGRVRLERVLGGVADILQNWAASSDAPTGAPAEVRIGVWMQGQEMRLFLNRHLQFNLRDPVLPGGTLGFFAHADGTTPVIVSFSDLEVRGVRLVPTPAPSATP